MKKLQNFLFSFLLISLLPSLGKAQTDPGIEMVFVEGGTFTMGCTREQTGCEDNERPAHKVTLSDYYIGKYEVTEAQWYAVMGTNPSYFSNRGRDNCPVERVSWQGASAFCKKLSKLTGKKYSLPTEAQWEYAARGGSESEGHVYAGSDLIAEVAWYSENSSSRTQRVGRKKPNELGIYDMSGNVWEWCFDVYDANYYKNSPEKDPDGPSEAGDYMVVRGGSWAKDAQDCRVAYRSGFPPPTRAGFIGFRVVLLP